MQAALEEIPSLAQAARVGGAWQTDGSRHTVGSRLTGEGIQDGTLLVPPQEGRTTLRVCYLFSGVKRKASIGEELKKMCLKEGIGLRMYEVDILVGGSVHDLLDKASQDRWMSRIESKTSEAANIPGASHTYGQVKRGGRATAASSCTSAFVPSWQLRAASDEVAGSRPFGSTQKTWA